MVAGPILLSRGSLSRERYDVLRLLRGRLVGFSGCCSKERTRSSKSRSQSKTIFVSLNDSSSRVGGPPLYEGLAWEEFVNGPLTLSTPSRNHKRSTPSASASRSRVSPRGLSTLPRRYLRTLHTVRPVARARAAADQPSCRIKWSMRSDQVFMSALCGWGSQPVRE